MSPSSTKKDHHFEAMMLVRHLLKEVSKIPVLYMKTAAIDEVRFNRLNRVFAPSTVADKIREIIGKTGGGIIGNFSHCTFTTEGVGRWREMTDGKIGPYSEVVSAKEERIETVVNKKILPELIKQLKEAHGYQEMGYDIMPLYEVDSEETFQGKVSADKNVG